MADPKAKRKPKARTLVNPKKTTAAAKQIMNANVTHSALLRLTPELRNRIYALVLGGQDLNFGYASVSGRQPLVHVYCAATSRPVSYEDNTSGPGPTLWDYDICYGNCRSDSMATGDGRSTPLDLSLLQVCKQIHGEAALLPFVLNTFVFCAPQLLAKLANRLLAARRPTLSCVSVDLITLLYRDFCKTDIAHLKKLTGIKTVTLRLHIRDVLDPPSETMDDAVQRMLDGCDWHSVKKVNIRLAIDSILDGWPGVFDPKGTPMLESCKDWIREAEHKLLEKWSK